jgi:hypothetical protein
VQLKRGDTAGQIVSVAQPLSLPAGEYTLVTEADGHGTQTDQVKLDQGETRTLSIKLTKLPPRGLTASSDWEKPERWSKSGEFDIVEGGDLIFLRGNPVEGVLTFFAQMQKGKRLQWVAAYRDAKNHCLFQMDRTHFQRIEIVDGKRRGLAKVAHGVAFNNGVELQIEIRDRAIIHRILNSGQQREIDRWSDPSGLLGPGRFALLVPGKDRVAIARVRLQKP